MFIVLLRFSTQRAKATELMAGHNEWIRAGLAERVILLAGSLPPHQGGVLLAHDISRAELEARLRADPFVASDVVQVELLEMTPSRADSRLEFLLAQRAPA